MGVNCIIQNYQIRSLTRVGMKQSYIIMVSLIYKQSVMIVQNNDTVVSFFTWFEGVITQINFQFCNNVIIILSVKLQYPNHT